MYEPQFWINPELYPYLTRWGLSMGYEVNTNEPHTILYNLSCIDPIRIRELRANDAPAFLNREEAVDLVEALEAIRTEPVKATGTPGEIFLTRYNPEYHPPIQLDEDMYQHHFTPVMKEAGYTVYAHHEGVFWYILRVSRSDCDMAQWETDQRVLCRSAVTGMVRDMEYERRMSPYLVAYNVLKSGETTTKTWLEGLDSVEKAMAVLEREKPRHVPTADWRIYKDLTAIVRHMKEDFPDEVMKPEGWLWLRIRHPGEYGADYWTAGLFDNVADTRVAILEEEGLDIYSVTAVYACIHQEGPSEEETPEAPPDIGALLAKYAGLLKRHRDQVVVYECDAIDLSVLHAVVCLGADHPEFQDRSPQSKAAIERFRGFCRRVWTGQGLSQREAQIMDELRLEVQKGEK